MTNRQLKQIAIRDNIQARRFIETLKAISNHGLITNEDIKRIQQDKEDRRHEYLLTKQVNKLFIGE